MNNKINKLNDILIALEKIIDEKKQNDNDSYTAKLLKEDITKVVQKVGEEATEVVIEAVLKNKDKTIYESADLLFHLLVMWNKLGIRLEDIAEELEKRRKNKNDLR
tara:strand:- start:229 stop:546 length:318 start_codon:yes stop_codon:yes gene_type:complete